MNFEMRSDPVMPESYINWCQKFGKFDPTGPAKVFGDRGEIVMTPDRLWHLFTVGQAEGNAQVRLADQRIRDLEMLLAAKQNIAITINVPEPKRWWQLFRK
jgi:hypothetical protein